MRSLKRRRGAAVIVAGLAGMLVAPAAQGQVSYSASTSGPAVTIPGGKVVTHTLHMTNAGPAQAELSVSAGGPGVGGRHIGATIGSAGMPTFAGDGEVVHFFGSIPSLIDTCHAPRRFGLRGYDVGTYGAGIRIDAGGTAALAFRFRVGDIAPLPSDSLAPVFRVGPLNSGVGGTIIPGIEPLRSGRSGVDFRFRARFRHGRVVVKGRTVPALRKQLLRVVARGERDRPPKGGRKIGKARTDKKGQFVFRTDNLQRGSHFVGLEYTTRQANVVSDFSCGDLVRVKGPKKPN